MLRIQKEIDQLGGGRDHELLDRYKYWLRILEFSYDSFIWIASNHDRSNVTKIYKGAKFGSLLQQNIQSVIETADELNVAENVFAFPLDFSRFSCIGDLLRITRHRAGGISLDFIEVKEGELNERILKVILSKGEEGLEDLFHQFGEKAVKQGKRMLKQERVAQRQLKYFDAAPGIYRGPDENRIVSELRIGLEDQFDDLIEILVERARQGEFSSDVVDDCLVVTALDSTSPQRYNVTDFSSRAVVYSAFLANEQFKNQDELSDAVQNITFIDWIEALNSAVCIPPLLRRPLRTRSFLDLMSGRIQLRFYLDPTAFLQLCREQKLQAGFIKKKITNRLKTSGGWRKGQYPIFGGRALGYVAGNFAGVIGWGILHEIMFNWRTPGAIARHLAHASAELQQLGQSPVGEHARRNWFSERDLEVV